MKNTLQNIIIGLVIAAIAVSLFSILSGDGILPQSVWKSHDQSSKGQMFETAALVAVALLLGILTNLYRKARYRKSSKWEEKFIEEFKATKAKKNERKQDN